VAASPAMGTTEMDWLNPILTTGGAVLAHVVAGLLCLAGLVLSCLALSGTWLVLLAALILRPRSTPRGGMRRGPGLRRRR
jgi:hypothetical protein